MSLTSEKGIVITHFWFIVIPIAWYGVWHLHSVSFVTSHRIMAEGMNDRMSRRVNGIGVAQAWQLWQLYPQRALNPSSLGRIV